MADSILKLKVESAEYDAKLKRASSTLQQFVDQTRKSGGDMKTASKDAVDFVRAMGGMETVAKNTKGQLKEFTNALQDLTTQYRELSDEEKSSDFGKAMAASMEQLTQRAADAKDAMGDVAAAIQNAASDTKVFDQLSAGATFVTSSFQTLQGAAQLVGIELGDNVQVIAKLQAAMAVTNGLTTIQNALQKQSALMQGVMAAKTALATAAQTAYAVATGNAAKAQAVFNTVANANPYVMLATVVAGVGAAMIAFGSDTDAATEAEKRNQEQTEAMKRMHEVAANSMQRSIGNAVADVTAKFKMLQNQWGSLKSVGEQKQWIDNNQSAFNALGLSVRNVNSAYQVFVAQAPQVIAALQAIARAQAMKEVYQDNLKKYYNEKYFSGEDGRTHENGGMYYKVNPEKETYRFSPPEEWRNSNLEFGTDYVRKTINGERRFQLTESGASKVNRYRNNQAWQVHTNRLSEMDKINNQIWKDWQAEEAAAAEAQKNLPWFTGGGLGGYSKGGFNIGGGGTGRGTGSTPPPKTDKPEVPIPVGSIKYYEQEIAKERESQSLATSRNDYEYFAGKIDTYTKKIRELRGETDAPIEMTVAAKGLSPASIDGWIQQLQDSLNQKTIGSKEYNSTFANLIDAQTFSNVLTEAVQEGIDIAAAGVDVETFWDTILDGKNISEDAWRSVIDRLNEQFEKAGKDGLDVDLTTGSVSRKGKKEEKEQRGWKETVNETLGTLSNIGSGLEQMGVRLPDSINNGIAALQGLMTVIDGVQTVITMFSTGSQTLNTAAVTANTAAVGSLTAIIGAQMAMAFFPLLAGGGIAHAAQGLIGGKRMSGDHVPVMVNSGELILNKAQQGNIASQLNGGSQMQLSAVVGVEAIKFILRNNGRRTGRGEYITTKFH